MLCACVPVDDGEIPRSALKFSCLEFFIARARAAEQNKFKALILVLPQLGGNLEKSFLESEFRDVHGMLP